MFRPRTVKRGYPGRREIVKRRFIIVTEFGQGGALAVVRVRNTMPDARRFSFVVHPDVGVFGIFERLLFHGPHGGFVARISRILGGGKRRKFRRHDYYYVSTFYDYRI